MIKHHDFLGKTLLRKTPHSKAHSMHYSTTKKNNTIHYTIYVLSIGVFDNIEVLQKF